MHMPISVKKSNVFTFVFISSRPFLFLLSDLDTESFDLSIQPHAFYNTCIGIFLVYSIECLF